MAILRRTVGQQDGDNRNGGERKERAAKLQISLDKIAAHN